MNIINEIVTACSAWIRPYLPHVVTALVATLLVVYGASLNSLVRRVIGRLHFLVRVLIFVLVCSFGYGILSLVLSKFFLRIFQQINNFCLAMVVVVIFIIVGILAEKKNQI